MTAVIHTLFISHLAYYDISLPALLSPTKIHAQQNGYIILNY